MVDDREFLADFLHKPIVETNDNSDNETDELALELGIDQISRETVLDQTEMSSLHYITGYCIRKIKKSNTHCSSCLLLVEATQSALTDPVQNLTQLKEYKGNSLVYCTEDCLKIFENAEKIFRESEKSLAKQSNLVSRLVHTTEIQTNNIAFPSCHYIKSKLLTHFFTLRLHIYAKTEQNIRKTKVQKTKGRNELGSKSMMRVVVRKYI